MLNREMRAFGEGFDARRQRDCNAQDVLARVPPIDIREDLPDVVIGRNREKRMRRMIVVGSRRSGNIG